jgi:hypothetical protein
VRELQRTIYYFLLVLVFLDAMILSWRQLVRGRSSRVPFVRADFVKTPNIDIAPHVRSCARVLVCAYAYPLNHVLYKAAAPEQRKQANRKAQRSGSSAPPKVILEGAVQPRILALAVQVYFTSFTCVDSHVGLMKPRRTGEKRGERTLSVTRAKQRTA